MKYLVLLSFVVFTTTATPLVKPHQKSKEPNIAFGTLARRGELPWTVAIWVDITMCGGVIISDEWILTSASCLDPFANDYRVIAGSTYISTGYDDPDRQMMASREAITHEDFDADTLENNIGLIKLPNKLVWTDTVQPANLTDVETEAGLVATISGYGVTRDDSVDYTSYRLYYGNVVTITNQQCQSGMHFPIYDSQLCAQPDRPLGPQICYGDGGTPLTTNSTNGEVNVIGIASFLSTGGCLDGGPGGFTRVSLYRDWIRENAGV